MSDEPYQGHGMTRAEKGRLNRITYWRRIRDEAVEKLRKLGYTRDESAAPIGDAVQPPKKSSDHKSS